MKSTRFHSVHGLPPAAGQKPDETTATDMAILCRELVKRPAALKYTGTKERPFRDGKFIMRNHNHLLGEIDGCDGLKTGYYEAAGFSIATTAKRGNVRIIALVMGSKDRKVRDAKAKEMLAKGFIALPPKIEASLPAVAGKPGTTGKKGEQPAVITTSAVQGAKETIPVVETEKPPEESIFAKGWVMFLAGLVVGATVFALALYLVPKRRIRKER
jgi:D-alanyl-D-alanine carboxypeptidase (penicillin-binding protein 5/6)